MRPPLFGIGRGWRFDSGRALFGRKDEVECGLFRVGPGPECGEVVQDVFVRGVALLFVFGAPFGDRHADRLAVHIDVEAIAMPGEARIDRLQRRPVVGEDIGVVDGRALGGREGERISVVEPRQSMEASAEAPVADLVGVEGEELSVVPAGGDHVPDMAAPVPDEVAVPVPRRLDLLDGEEVAGVELEVAARGADDEAVARRDENLAGIVVPRLGVAAGDGDRDFAGALLVREGALAQFRRQGTDLVMGARDDQGGPVGRFLAVPVPVLDEFLQRLFEIPAEMEPVAFPVGGDRPGDALLRFLLAVDEPVAEV